MNQQWLSHSTLDLIMPKNGIKFRNYCWCLCVQWFACILLGTVLHLCSTPCKQMLSVIHTFPPLSFWCSSVLTFFFFLFSNPALVSVSEEVRSRCHLKHRTAQYIVADSPSSECLSSEFQMSSGAYVSPSVSTSTFLSTLSSAPGGSTSSASTSPGGNSSGGGPLSAPPTTTSLGRRQKSCDLLDQTAMTAARQGKNAHLTQSQVWKDESSIAFPWVSWWSLAVRNYSAWKQVDFSTDWFQFITVFTGSCLWTQFCVFVAHSLWNLEMTCFFPHIILT